jgi:diguanylate cyclase (GGDEF)-like protein/putative nucleotidyltransferase with HDIG domain
MAMQALFIQAVSNPIRGASEQILRLPAPARRYLLAVWCCGLPLLAAASWRLASVNPGLALVWAAAGVWLGSRKITLLRGEGMWAKGGSMSVGFTVVYAAVFFLGVDGAAVAGGVTMIGQGLAGPKRHRVHQVLFNMATAALAAWAAATVYIALGGQPVQAQLRAAGPTTLTRELQMGALPPVLATTLLYYLLNTVSVAAIIALSTAQGVFRVWRENVLWTAPGYFAAASIAAFAKTFYLLLGPAVFFMAMPIVYLIHYSYRIYVEKVEQHRLHIEQLQIKQQRLEEVYHSAIQSLAIAIDAKDRYTRMHINRVQVYAVAIARYLNVGTEELEAIRTAALLHDVGKLAVPEHILSKPGKLTEEEYRRIQAHVATGAMMLEPVDFPWPVVPIVMTHHERWDGHGYPRRLKAEEIPLGGRIVGLADFFDAITSDRPYRRSMPRDEALALVRADRGARFDPRVVDAFLAIYARVQPEIEAINSAERSDDDGTAVERSPDKSMIDPRVLDEIGRASGELYALYDAVHPLGRSLDLRATLEMLVEKTAHIVGFHTCIIFRAWRERGELEAEIVAGLYQERFHGMTIKLGEGLSGWVAQCGDPVVNRPAMMDLARKMGSEDTIDLNSSLVVPLVLRGEAVGTISLYHQGYNFYTEDHRRLLTIIADHAAPAIDNARQFEQTQELAMTDALTGLANARALSEYLKRRLSHCAIFREPLAVLLVDLDHFKRVNDRLGHLAGDRVLSEVASALRGAAGAEAFVSRYAGDEFVIVLPGADELLAREVEENVRRALVDCQPDRRFGAELEIVASVGLAVFPADGTEPRALVNCADKRMYEDKFGRRRAQTLGASESWTNKEGAEPCRDEGIQALSVRREY